MLQRKIAIAETRRDHLSIRDHHLAVGLLFRDHTGAAPSGAAPCSFGNPGRADTGRTGERVTGHPTQPFILRT